MLRFVTAIFAIFLSAQTANAMTYFLSEDLGVSGFQHLCRYSDGEIYAFKAVSLCPLSINVDGPAFNGRVTGFHRGEYRDGLTKVCVYDVMGQQRFLRIDGVNLCPLSYDF